jgi:membrane-associated phospholipid phosphatase
MRGRSLLVALWLCVSAMGHMVLFAVLWRLFIRSRTGQLLDYLALSGNWIGRRHITGIIDLVLNTMSVVSLAAAIIVVCFIGLAQRRVAVALVAALLIVGSNGMTQLIKYGIYRPQYGIDEAREAAGNSFPSGHTAIAASVAVALVFVLPPRMRGLGAVLGAGYMALAGVATLSAGWHRPSDAVGATVVVGGWAAIAGLVLLLVHRNRPQERPHFTTAGLLLAAALVLLLVALAGVHWTNQVLQDEPGELSRDRLLAAYGGGAAGIAGTAALVMGLVLATIHRVVPRAPAEPAQPVEPIASE